MFALACAVTALGACAAAGENTEGGRRPSGGSGSSGSSGAGAATGEAGSAGTSFGNGTTGGMSAMPPKLPPVQTMFEDCAATGTTAKNEIRPVDIIWAIDSSPSMGLIIDAMEMQLNTLATTVTAAGIDVHIILLSARLNEDPIFGNPIPGSYVVCVMPPVGSGNCDNDTNLPGYHHLVEGCGSTCWVGSHNALGRLVGGYPDYAADLRPNSIKYFGAVTDDTADDTLDFKAAADKFTAEISANPVGSPMADWKFFAIINPSTGGAYQMLADQTGGITGTVGIGQDYTALFNMLATTVTETSQLTCEWAIPPIPDGAGQFNKNKVNVTYTPGGGGAPMQFGHIDTDDPKLCETAPEGGWYYDDKDAPTKVLVCPKTCDTLKSDLTGKVDVLFGCDTIKAPT